MEDDVRVTEENSKYVVYATLTHYIKFKKDDEGRTTVDKFLEKADSFRGTLEELQILTDIFIQKKMKQYNVQIDGTAWQESFELLKANIL